MGPGLSRATPFVGAARARLGMAEPPLSARKGKGEEGGPDFGGWLWALKNSGGD